MQIAAAARTPFTPVHGRLSGWHPVALGAHVLEAARDMLKLDPQLIDFVIAGCAMPVGAQGGNVARAALLAAGWPSATGAFTVDAGEAASHQALHAGLAMTSSGQAHVVAVLGVEVASLVPAGASALNRNYGPQWGPAIDRFDDDGGLVPEGIALDRLGSQLQLEADDLRRYADDARTRATPSSYIVSTPAIGNGKADDKISGTVDADELGALPDDPTPLFSDDGTTTAATVAPVADGAAVVFLVSDVAAEQLGFNAIATTEATATTGAEPPTMFGALPALIHGLNGDEPAATVVVDTAGAAAEVFGWTVTGAQRRNPAGGNLARGRPTGAAGLAAIIEAIDGCQDGGSAIVVSTSTDGMTVGTRLLVRPQQPRPTS